MKGRVAGTKSQDVHTRNAAVKCCSDMFYFAMTCTTMSVSMCHNGTCPCYIFLYVHFVILYLQHVSLCVSTLTLFL